VAPTRGWNGTLKGCFGVPNSTPMFIFGSALIYVPRPRDPSVSTLIFKDPALPQGNLTLYLQSQLQSAVVKWDPPDSKRDHSLTSLRGPR
jgi:hypothetical protein